MSIYGDPFMATHLVKILSRLGWMRFPGPARTPLGLCGRHTVAGAGGRWVGGGWAAGRARPRALPPQGRGARGRAVAHLVGDGIIHVDELLAARGRSDDDVRVGDNEVVKVEPK